MINTVIHNGVSLAVDDDALILVFSLPVVGQEKHDGLVGRPTGKIAHTSSIPSMQASGS